MSHRIFIACVVALLVTGCDFGRDGAIGTTGATGAAGATGATGAAGAKGANGVNGTAGVTSLVASVVEPAGANCAFGGNKITSGPDTNGNGVLDASEVTSTGYVCSGSPGIATLVAIAVVPAGAHCAAGGNQITSGPDTNGNGVLDTGEVISTIYVCNGINGTNGTNGTNGATGATGATGAAGTNGSNGAAGANGTNGTNGVNSLIAIAVESPGAHCTYGGNQITSGTDTNNNGTLDLSEVTATAYVCNGAPGPGITWVDVTTQTAQAVSNKGYLADNVGQVTITLPATPAVGDLVQVSGVGSGGWTIAQNAGQSIATTNLAGGNIGNIWTVTPSSVDWASVANSADGVHRVAVGFNDFIYTSDNGGATGAQITGPGQRAWSDVASSQDGSHYVAVANGAQIYTSIDFGANWTARETNRSWTSVASSANGMKLVAVAQADNIYTSIDGGVTWTPEDAARNWVAVASSYDGTHLVAAESGGQIYVSANSGASWVPEASNRAWTSLASSADGSRLVAGVSGGALYTSTDFGATWTAHGPVQAWTSVASSIDGTRLVAVATGAQIYISDDCGVTWTAHESTQNWTSVAITADGSRLVANESGGGVHASVPTTMTATTVGVTGGISATQYDTVDLQFVGNGVFLVRSSTGVFNIQ